MPFWTKVIYGTGDWSLASFGTLRQIFYAIFLTDAVGLEPRLASVGALLGIVWDAVNDPLVGSLSDRVRTRWGRRRPFLLGFSVPFGLGFLLLWWAPPWKSQAALLIHITLAYMMSDSLQTLVSVPFYALTPEMTPDYDERTQLTSFRMFFNLLASLAAAVLAPEIVDSALSAGFSLQQGYLAAGALFGGLATVPLLLVGFFVRERLESRTIASQGLGEVAAAAWENVPFRFATGIYILNWITFDLVGLMLPFILIYWVASGDLLATTSILGLEIALESAVLGLMLVAAIAALPLWTWLARAIGKRMAYMVGMGFWGVVQILIILVQPGQVFIILVLGVLAGLSVSTAHILPDAMFPDVIEWDELRTGRRCEGAYYGIKNFMRKLAGAVAVFVGLQALGWFGYQAPPASATRFSQAPSTLLAIRIVTGPVGALLLACAIALAWFYPITRKRHARIRRLLLRKQGRDARV